MGQSISYTYDLNNNELFKYNTESYSAELDNKYIIRGITLLENDRGRYLGMPSRRLIGEKKAYRDTCHPINQDVRDELTKKVFDAYDEFIKNEV